MFLWIVYIEGVEGSTHTAMVGNLTLPPAGTWTDGAIRKWVKQSTYALVGSGFKVEKYGTEASEPGESTRVEGSHEMHRLCPADP